MYQKNPTSPSNVVRHDTGACNDLSQYKIIVLIQMNEIKQIDWIDQLGWKRLTAGTGVNVAETQSKAAAVGLPDSDDELDDEVKYSTWLISLFLAFPYIN